MAPFLRRSRVENVGLHLGRKGRDRRQEEDLIHGLRVFSPI